MTGDGKTSCILLPAEELVLMVLLPLVVEIDVLLEARVRAFERLREPMDVSNATACDQNVTARPVNTAKATLVLIFTYRRRVFKAFSSGSLNHGGEQPSTSSSSSRGQLAGSRHDLLHSL